MPRGLYFSKALSEGLIDGGKFAFQISLGYPSNWKGNLVFCVTSLGGGGLYLEGLIHGGAYFRNVTVIHSVQEPSTMC